MPAPSNSATARMPKKKPAFNKRYYLAKKMCRDDFRFAKKTLVCRTVPPVSTTAIGHRASMLLLLRSRTDLQVQTENTTPCG